MPFEEILVFACAITGVVWLIDAIFFAKKRKADPQTQVIDGKPVDPALVDWSKAFFPVLFFVLILRSFIAEPFRIPSSSMMPLLQDGDFILVNKFAYGLRLPVVKTKLVDIGEVKRGDVVVFRPPHKPKEDWIKRVVGLPGDTVEYRNNTLFVNGDMMQQTPIDTFITQGNGSEMNGALRTQEQLMDVPHEVLLRPHGQSPSTINEVWTVPEGHYFVMGDNRNNSHDSRFWEAHYLPVDRISGKAFMIWMNWDGKKGGIDFKRIGNAIK